MKDSGDISVSDRDDVNSCYSLSCLGLSSCDALSVLQREVLVRAAVGEPEEAAGGGAEAERHQPEEPRLVPWTYPLAGL